MNTLTMIGSTVRTVYSGFALHGDKSHGNGPAGSPKRLADPQVRILALGSVSGTTEEGGP